MGAVKGANPSRADRARQTRRRMLESARELFVTEGYAATTMDRIADQAGVAVQTLYYTFRTKGKLLCEVVEATAAGEDDPPPVAQRPWMQKMLDEPPQAPASWRSRWSTAPTSSCGPRRSGRPSRRPQPTPTSTSTGAGCRRPARRPSADGCPARRAWRAA